MQCAPSQRGPYCEICAEGFFAGGNGALCRRCEGSSFFTFVPGIIIGVVVLIALSCVAVRCKTVIRGAATSSLQKASSPSAFRGHLEEDMEEELQRQFPRLARLLHKASRSLVKIRIVIAFFQMLQGVGITFAIPYPPVYVTVLNVASSIVQVDLPTAMPLDCMVPLWFTAKLVLRTLLPLLVMLLSFVGGRMLTRCSYVHLGGLVSSSWFYILFLVYPSCSTATFHAFMCDQLDDGTQMLRADYTVCWEGEHIRAVCYALVMVVIYPLGTPLLFAALCYANHEQLVRIRRAELTAMAEDTKLVQHRLSTDHHWDVHQGGGDRNSKVRHWAPDIDGPLDTEMMATIEANNVACELVAKLRGELSPVMQELTEGYEMRCYW
jgi:hypothetical protein